MGIDVISSHILVESTEAETDEEFCGALESMILQTYSHRPDWLQFSAGARFVLAGRHFREFACFAGSVSLTLIQRAERDGGFERSIVVRADNDGAARVYEIRAGRRRDFSSYELHAA